MHLQNGPSPINIDRCPFNFLAVLKLRILLQFCPLVSVSKLKNVHFCFEELLVDCSRNTLLHRCSHKYFHIWSMWHAQSDNVQFLPEKSHSKNTEITHAWADVTECPVFPCYIFISVSQTNLQCVSSDRCQTSENQSIFHIFSPKLQSCQYLTLICFIWIRTHER